MELGMMWVAFGAILGGVLWVLRRANSWVYERKLGEKRFSLPPGDLGWPFIGNMWSFLRAFKSTDPDSFLSSFITRYDHYPLSLSLSLLRIHYFLFLSLYHSSTWYFLMFSRIWVFFR